MKPRILIVVFFVPVLMFFIPAYSQVTIHAKTDQRIELLSVVFRLAGNPEYNMNPFKAYVNAKNRDVRIAGACLLHPVFCR